MKKLLTSKLFLLGLIIRFIVMPFTAHFDLRGINFGVYNLPFKHVFNVYEVACCQPVDYIVNINFAREYFIYPPLTYFTLGSFMWVLKPLYGGEFVNWIQGYGTNINAVLTHPNVFRYLFLMKLPYLVFDIGILVLLQQFFSKKIDKNRMIKAWWLNPIVIFLPYMWGQFDIIPAVFVLWSVLQIARKKPYQGALLIGIAASFKSYPLMFLPFLALTAATSFKQMLKLTAAALAPFLITTAPFWGHAFFRKTVLFSWQSQKLMDFLVGIGGSDGIYPFVIGYALIFLYSAYSLRGRNSKLHIPITMSLMWYYATVNFHQQWFMWVLPFLAILYVKHRSELAPIAWWVLGLFFLRLLEIQANVTVELFAWLDPAVTDLPKTRYVLSLLYDINKLRNIVNSLVVATSLWMIWYLNKKEGAPKGKDSLI